MNQSCTALMAAVLAICSPTSGAIAADDNQLPFPDYMGKKQFISPPYLDTDRIPLIREGATGAIPGDKILTTDSEQDVTNKTIDCSENTCTGQFWQSSNHNLQPGFDWTGCNGNAYECGLFLSQAPTNLGQAAQNTIQINRDSSYSTEIAVNSASGTGATATLTFSGLTAAATSTVPVGSAIVVSGMTPSGYNGSYTVTASTPGSISYANTTTGNMTVAGTFRFDGGVFGSLKLYTFTSPSSGMREWPLVSNLTNYSDGTLDVTPGAGNVAINGTVFKKFKPGYSYAGQIGPSWGGNFVCDDETGTTNPTYSCVASEMDNFFLPGTTDDNNQRSNAHLSWGGPGVTIADE